MLTYIDLEALTPQGIILFRKSAELVSYRQCQPLADLDSFVWSGGGPTWRVGGWVSGCGGGWRIRMHKHQNIYIRLFSRWIRPASYVKVCGRSPAGYANAWDKTHESSLLGEVVSYRMFCVWATLTSIWNSYGTDMHLKRCSGVVIPDILGCSFLARQLYLFVPIVDVFMCWQFIPYIFLHGVVISKFSDIVDNPFYREVDDFQSFLGFTC